MGRGLGVTLGVGVVVAVGVGVGVAVGVAVGVGVGVGVGVAIKRQGLPKSRRGQTPASGESWPESGANANIVVHVPDRRYTGARIVKQVIRFPVTVKVGNAR